jgi:Flp pilus assembly protein TadD/2-polyprenyl-3-methyl-5-hydroxy-6-metoxy-1,4-benzoquinol methylase
MKKIHVNSLEPSQEQLNSLLEYYQNGQYVDAEKLSLSITQEFPKHPFAWKVLGAVLKQMGRISESLIVCQKSVQLDPQDAEAHNNLGVTFKEQGRLEEAETNYKKAIELKPDYAEAHNNLGITLKELGRLDEAAASYMQAITLKPDYTDAHYSLGVLLKKLGRLDEAEASYRKAITLKLDYVEAHTNLGNIMNELGRLDEAEASYRQAITLKPDYAEAHNNLGVLLKKLGRSDEACAAYIQAINLNPNLTDAYVNLGIAIKNVRFNSSNVKLYPVLTQLLSTGNFARPIDLAPCILSLLKHDPLIKNLLLEKNFATSLKEANSIIASLDKLTLLHHLMRLCPLPDLQFEKFFVTMRSLLLMNLDNIEASPELIYFLSTLSLHCFTNEYVYVEKDEETELVENLETEIMKTIAKSEQPEAKKILCLASYRPLHQYSWCQKLKALDNLKEVRSQMIVEPHAESAMMAEISMLGEISDDVSRKVRTQYEENPYPRWVKLGIPTEAKSISKFCAEVNLDLHSKSIKNVTAPAILNAGCGTGQHSIQTASNFSDCQVTAVDLSLASLAYAKRKTTELGITNIEYLQADILRLDQLDQKFDIIESVGVIHHMDEPMTGWKVLTDLLKPSGLMKIGLYSELARQHIVEVRKEITLQKVGTSESEIREFRRSLAESNDENHQRLTKSLDFFSLSTLRDLIFHVQEHRFTLPQIKKCLDEFGLKFCGFGNKDTISNFRELHGEEADIYDLALWHQYEESNPQAFAAMYQFWCQKL